MYNDLQTLKKDTKMKLTIEPILSLNYNLNLSNKEAKVLNKWIERQIESYSNNGYIAQHDAKDYKKHYSNKAIKNAYKKKKDRKEMLASALYFFDNTLGLDNLYDTAYDEVEGGDNESTIKIAKKIVKLEGLKNLDKYQNKTITIQ